MLTFSPLLALGIDQSSDIDGLLALGIRQFFAGYIPQDWLDRYGSQLSPNRRYRLREQFTDAACLAQAAEKLQRCGASLNLLLNCPFTTPALEPQIRQQAQFLLGLPHSGIVVGSPAVALLLQELGCNRLVLSNLFGCYSCDSVAWCIETFHPRQIVLPRDLHPDELTAIVTAFPDCSFETFLCADVCRFSEPFCFVEHGYDSVIAHDLCSYAGRWAQHHTRAPLRFRELARNRSLPDDQAALQLAPKRLDPTWLLDELCRFRLAGMQPEQAATLENLARCDLAGLLRLAPELRNRAQVILSGFQHPAAARLCSSLAAAVSLQQAATAYRQFHGLDPVAVRAAVTLFSRYPNIVAWKVPARGRAVMTLLDAVQKAVAGEKP